jgi:hypothetical protein
MYRLVRLGDFWKSSAGLTLLIGILMAVVMLYNVWMIIWPNQQIVIANARKVQGGGPTLGRLCDAIEECANVHQRESERVERWLTLRAGQP